MARTRSLRRACAGAAVAILASRCSPALAQQDGGAPHHRLPDGAGPLYTSSGALLSSLSRWAEANPRLLSLTKDATDPETGKSLALAVFTDHGGEGGQPNGGSSSNATSSLPRQSRARVFVTCGIHAREIVTVDACFALLRLLASPDDRDALSLLSWPEMRASLGHAGIISQAAASGSAERALPAVRAAARRLAGRAELAVMPLLNPFGREKIEQEGAFKLRVNGWGVDLNRNMRAGWLPPRPGQRPGSDTYPGPAAASEWETRAVNAATSLLGVDSYVDLHSGFVSLMGPQASSSCGLRSAMTRDSARAHDRAMRAMQRAMPSPTVAGPTARVLYPAAGTTLDDAFQLRGARVSLAVEVYDEAFASRAGYSCPSFEAFWAAPCDDDEGGGGGVRCTELSSSSSSSAARGESAEFAAAFPRVPDGELLWEEIDDAEKLRELRARHGVSEAQVARVSAGARAAVRARAARAAAAGEAEGQNGTLPLLPERVVRAEAWWRDDPVMRHASGDWADEQWNYLTTFNPTEPAVFRDTVARWVAALWLFALDAERQS